ncbi:sensor histidine kinase [Flavobacterium aquicola]|uniref:Histidine kinase/DNA gyrase B/HSP90-like ATPase n=1 Tax=Flavobacterium aquicola TaxID=1682742 RepID=A0A3E0DYQ0_9FLAO|nr:ATP-binding protein [Flavobacterium aquicola]REG90480.1 histidine kinase/DNA gyrase B/HSP90-like ATPase [Flavobacterium aquicola]
MEKRVEFNSLDISPSKNQLSAAVRTLEMDRKRIAQNLHDEISSKLNVISLNCHLLKIPNLPQKDIEEITKNIIDYTSKALDSSKKMTYSLLPPVLDKFGLHAGIEELCAELTDSENVDIQYENNIQFNFNDNDKHIHVFRILQELLANSIQHGKATSITISFNENEGGKICKYSDNGIGFDLNLLESHDGLGMKNVAGRVSILGGNLAIESQMNSGVSFIFNF